MAQENYESLVRAAVLGALSAIPDAGGLISGIVGVLWEEDQQDPWEDFRKQVEALIDEKIDASAYDDKESDLKIYKSKLELYHNALSESPKDLCIQYQGVVTALTGEFHKFESTDQQKAEILLPLYAQMVTLSLSLFRDGMLHGKSWGLDDDYLESTLKPLILGKTGIIEEAQDYVDNIFSTGSANRTKQATKTTKGAKAFNITNSFIRGMTLAVLDFRNTWEYFDPVKYPGKVSVNLDREIFSDAVGTAESDGFKVRGSEGRISEVDLWYDTKIYGLEVVYETSDSSTKKTGVMGYDARKVSGTKLEKLTLKSSDIITEVESQTGDIVDTLRFKGISDGQAFDTKWIAAPGGSDSNSFLYDGHILSSVTVMGYDEAYGSPYANCAVFGFKLKAAVS